MCKFEPRLTWICTKRVGIKKKNRRLESRGAMDMNMNNLRSLPIAACIFFLVLIPLSAAAFPPASPAGGNYLVLDGVADYAVLDFQTFGMLLPERTDEFTVEAWIYPTKSPDKNTAAAVLSQQVRVRIVNDEFQALNEIIRGINNLPHLPEGDLVLIMDAHLAGRGPHVTTPFFPTPIMANQWHYIAFQAKGNQTTTIINDLARTWMHATHIGDDFAWRPKDFTLGGFGKKIEVPWRNRWFWGSFTGYIDEVRISSVARYDVTKKDFVPHSKFKDDAKTVALWHFDEPGGTREFSDASGNAYHLVGEGGARTGNPLAVEAQGKLTTTWGRLKQ
ncbi:hypothetical protein C6496_10685 [Candidatus Poribacteria bacterium]|nr:MAG: hypothetical protein C6496_10685 [Candidatus Poribacteria bacterium]